MVFGGFKVIAIVGVIGLVNIGNAIARRLLDQGHILTAWSRTKLRYEPLEHSGALWLL